MATDTELVNVKHPEPSDDKDPGIADLWRNFSQNTGFHGFNKLVWRNTYKWRCFRWTVAIAGMTAFLTYNVVKEFQNYYSCPTMTDIKVEIKEEMAFPAVTFCNQSPLNKSKLHSDPGLLNYFLSLSSFSLMAEPINWTDPTYGDFYEKELLAEWWTNRSMEVSKMLYLCVFNGIPFKCTQNVTLVHTFLGVCYTFNANVTELVTTRFTGSEGNLAIFAFIDQKNYVYNEKTTAGLKVSIHDPRVHPDVSMSEITASPGTSTLIVLKKSTFKYLPLPFKAFGENNCLDTDDINFNNTLKYFDHYTYEHCLHECVVEKVYNVCGCVKYSDPPFGPACSFRLYKTCYILTTNKFQLKARVPGVCNCKMPCKFDVYDTRVSSSHYPSDLWTEFLVSKGIAKNEDILRENFLELRIYYENLMVQTIEQVPQYKLGTIIANLGGQMGICLGASILTLTELGEFLAFCIFFIFQRLFGRRQLKQNQRH